MSARYAPTASVVGLNGTQNVPRRRTRWKRLDELPHLIQVLLGRSVEQGRDPVERHVVVENGLVEVGRGCKWTQRFGCLSNEVAMP